MVPGCVLDDQDDEMPSHAKLHADQDEHLVADPVPGEDVPLAELQIPDEIHPVVHASKYVACS